MFYLKSCKQTGLRRSSLCYLVAMLLLLSGSLPAKDGTTSSKTEVFQIPPNQRPKIDGRLTEPLWEQASPIGPLTMVEPKEGMLPSEQTEIRVAVTQEAIYFGIMCHDRYPDRVVSYTMQRDAQLSGEDHVKIVLDTFLNGRTGYIFAINPNGARYDALIEKEGGGENPQWDGIWEAATLRSEDGWSAEIYIPIKTLRFGIGLRQWGFNVERRIQRLLETDRWASPNRNFKVTNISQAGQLTRAAP